MSKVKQNNHYLVFNGHGYLCTSSLIIFAKAEILMRTWYLSKHTATRPDLKSRFCCLKLDVNELGYLSLKSSWCGSTFAAVNSYNSFIAHRAAAYTQHNLNAQRNLIPLGFSVTFKVAKPTSYFQIKLDIWSQQNYYYPLKWRNSCLGCSWRIFYGTESGSLSQMCRMYSIPRLPKHIQFHLSLEVFKLPWWSESAVWTPLFW